jgi:hypothetical protein
MEDVRTRCGSALAPSLSERLGPALAPQRCRPTNATAYQCHSCTCLSAIKSSHNHDHHRHNQACRRPRGWSFDPYVLRAHPTPIAPATTSIPLARKQPPVLQLYSTLLLVNCTVQNAMLIKFRIYSCLPRGNVRCQTPPRLQRHLRPPLDPAEPLPTQRILPALEVRGTITLHHISILNSLQHRHSIIPYKTIL